MTKRLANLIYKIPEGTKVTTRYAKDGGIIHENIKTLRELVFEKRDVFNSNWETTEFMSWGHIVVVKNELIRTYRYRRNKLVEIPSEWAGKVTYPQTIRKRKKPSWKKVAKTDNKRYKQKLGKI